jgi:hypothetical protein
MSILGKIGDIIGGLFLILAGSVFILIYFCFNKTDEFALIKLWLFLFMFCLGFIAMILGFRRIVLAIRDIINLIRNKQ